MTNETPITNNMIGTDDVRNKRPLFGMGAKTHEYWYRKIRDAMLRLDIDNRAAKARELKRKYQEYDFHNAPDQSINAISRQIITFANNVVMDDPFITPQFNQEDEELEWRHKLHAFVAANIRDNDMKTLLAEMIWDNAYGDIAWLKTDFQTQFSNSMPTDVTANKQQYLQQLSQIDQEHAAMYSGQIVPTSPEDWHDVHNEQHQKRLDQMNATKETMAQAVQMGMPAQQQLQQAETECSLLGLHMDEHLKANRLVSGEQFGAKRWPSYLVYYDPDARNWDECDWYAIEVVDRREALAARDDFSNVNSLKGMPGIDIDEYHENRSTNRYVDAGPVFGTQQQAQTETYIRYWIIHSRIDGQLIVVAEQEQVDQKPLFCGDWPFEGDIIRPLVIRPVNDRVHGVPLISVLDFVHMQLRDVQDKIHQCVKKTPPVKFFIEKRLLNDAAVKNAITDPNKLWVPVNAVPKESILPWAGPQIDRNLIDERDRLLNELQLESGIPEVYNAGETSETATATSIRDRQAGNKIGDAQGKIAKLISWYCTALIDTFRLHGTQEQWVRIVGDDGLGWDHFTPDLIPRDVFWMVDADSLAPSKREMDKKQHLELLQTLAPFAAFITNWRPLLTATVNKFDAMQDPSSLFTQPPMQPGMMAPQPGQGGGIPPQQQQMPQPSPMSQNGMPINESGAELAHATTA